MAEIVTPHLSQYVKSSSLLCAQRDNSLELSFVAPISRIFVQTLQPPFSDLSLLHFIAYRQVLLVFHSSVMIRLGHIFQTADSEQIWPRSLFGFLLGKLRLAFSLLDESRAHAFSLFKSALGGYSCSCDRHMLMDAPGSQSFCSIIHLRLGNPHSLLLGLSTLMLV